MARAHRSVTLGSGQNDPILGASEVYGRNSRAATALKRSSTVPVHTLGRPNVPRGSPDPQTTHRLLKVPPGAPPGHPQKGRMRRSRARAALSGSAAQGAAHQRVHLEEKASRAPKIISGLPGARAHGTCDDREALAVSTVLDLPNVSTEMQRRARSFARRSRCVRPIGYDTPMASTAGFAVRARWKRAGLGQRRAWLTLAISTVDSSATCRRTWSRPAGGALFNRSKGAFSPC